MATDRQLQVMNAHVHGIETEHTWHTLEPAAGRPFTADVSQASHMCITCRTDSDRLWRLHFARKHSVIIDADHGHTDPFSQLDVMFLFRAATRHLPGYKSRMVCH